MKNNFWSLIWSSFNDIQGSLITFLGIFVSILIARFPIKTKIPLDFFIVVTLILLLIIATLIKAVSKLFIANGILQQKAAKPITPKILSARQYQIATQTGILCLLTKSEQFSINIFISCYYQDADGFELLIGTGTIINIQGDGKIQALIDTPTSGYQDILEKLTNNDSQIISRIVIKPTISRDIS